MMDLEWHWRRPGVNRWGARGSAASLILGLIFSVLGFSFLGVGIGTALWTQSFLRKSAATEGSVVELREVHDSQNNSLTYAPVFRFAAKDGRSYQIKSNSSSNPPGFQIGDTVRVLYDPANPQSAKIDTFWQLWAIPTVFSILGGAFSFAGVVLLVLGRFQKRQEQKKQMQPWAVGPAAGSSPGVSVRPDVTYRGGSIDPE